MAGGWRLAAAGRVQSGGFLSPYQTCGASNSGDNRLSTPGFNICAGSRPLRISCYDGDIVKTLDGTLRQLKHRGWHITGMPPVVFAPPCVEADQRQIAPKRNHQRRHTGKTHYSSSDTSRSASSQRFSFKSRRLARCGYPRQSAAQSEKGGAHR